MRRLTFAIAIPFAVALLCLALGNRAGVRAGVGKGQVLPPDAHAYGASLGEWSARHWQWAFSQPITAHPLLDSAPFDTGQSGEVLFLGGSFASEFTGTGQISVAQREITIAPGTALFFPIFNAEASEVEGYGTTDEELLGAAEFFATLINPETLYLIVDGVEVPNLAEYGAFSGIFEVGPVPEENLFEFFIGGDIPAGTTSKAAAFGYYALLAPLPPGEHVIKFGGTVDVFGYLIEQDTTYTITVQP